MPALVFKPAHAAPLAYEEVLAAHGYDVQVFETSEAAWAYVEQIHPRLLVLAQVTENSLALCRKMRAAERDEATLVLAVVASDATETLQAVIEAGVDDIVPATASRAYLDACVQLLGRRARKRERHLRVEDELLESEVRTRAILNTTVDGVITIDEQGHIESFNPAAERIFGYAAEEVIGRNIKMLMPPPYHEEHDGYLQSYKETGRRRIIGIGREVVGLRKDGSLFPMDLAVSEVPLGDGRVLFTGMIRDITERRRLEQQILRISEEERRRIGQDLHDGLGQMLTGIGLIMQNLARTMAEQDIPEAGEISEVTELIKEADQFARGLARGLVPVDLAAGGLVAAVERLAHNAEMLFGIRCTFEHLGSVLIHDNTVATHLFRIAQEAVSNAVKHGRARHVRISLAAGGRQVRLRVHDDGVGFPKELDEEKRGMGVRIMHHRARVIGASLDITDSLEGGTILTCTLRNVNQPLPMGGEEYGRIP